MSFGFGRWKSEANAEKKKEKLARLANIFSRWDSVIARRHIHVDVQTSNFQAPAWSSASNITFNETMIPDAFGADEAMMLKGLNVHEIAHVLYTPRNGSDISRWVQDNDLWNAFNILEDQRIETLLTGRFPSIVPWLTATMTLYLLDSPDAIQSAYPLVRGRRYLPVQVRQIARQEYKDQANLGNLERVIDEYRTLLFPEDAERAKPLIEEFDKLIKELENMHPQDMADPHGHNDRPVNGIESSSSRPAPKSEQRRDRDRALGKDSGGQDEKDMPPLKPKPKDENGNDLKPQPKSGKDPADGDPADGDGKSDKKGDKGDQNGGSSAGYESPEELEEAIFDVLNDIVDEAYSSVKKEVEDFIREVNNDPTLMDNNAVKPNAGHFVMKNVDARTALASRTFGRELERLRTDYDPGWNKGVSSGRLNPMRAMRGDELDTVYDRWDEGRQDVTDIEAVILLDNSGSMGGTPADLAYRSMWATKKALDGISAATTVITFNSDSYVLYEANEKVTNQIKDAGAGGGTVPTAAVQYAYSLFAQSHRAIKILICITDGEWGYSWWGGNDQANGKSYDDLILEMRKAGVLTSLVFIADGYTSENDHNCEIMQTVHKPEDLLKVARELVRVGIKRQIANN